MNITQMRHFLVLAEKERSRTAADELFVSQQGLNVSIARLEKELGSPLFDREGGRCLLNENGRVFREHAEIIVRENQKILDYFSGLHAAEKTCFRIAASRGSLTEFGMEMISAFKKDYPACEPEISEYGDNSVARMLWEGNADLGFDVEPVDAEKFIAHRIFQCRVGALIHVSNPLADKDPLLLEDLKGQRLISVDVNSKVSAALTAALQQKGLRLQLQFVEEVMSVHRLTEQNQGIGFTNKLLFQTLRTPGAVFRPIRDADLFWNVDIVRKRGAKLSKSAQAFYQYIVSRYSGDKLIKVE